MPEDATSEACIRCRDRNSQCEFAVASQRKGESRGSDVSNTTRSASKPPEPQGSTITLALSRGSGQSANLETTIVPQGPPNSSASFEWLTEDAWSIGLGVLFETPLYIELGIEPLVLPWSEEFCDVEDGISSLKPWDFPSSSLFEPRTFSKPSQGSLVLLALQILRSYPFMIVRKAALPPFINPLQASWAETGEGPGQQVS